MRNCVMYENVRVEMARKGLTIMDIAKSVGMKRETLSKKLSWHSPLHIDEAFNIQQTCFPDIGIQVLFKESAGEGEVITRRS